MKLRKNIYKTYSINTNRFEKHPRFLKKGDYIRLLYLSQNQKKRKSEGTNIRINDRTFLLFKKRHKRNSLHFVVTSLYKYERVRLRFLITSPYMLRVVFVRKAQKNFDKLFYSKHQFQ